VKEKKHKSGGKKHSKKSKKHAKKGKHLHQEEPKKQKPAIPADVATSPAPTTHPVAPS